MTPRPPAWPDRAGGLAGRARAGWLGWLLGATLVGWAWLPNPAVSPSAPVVVRDATTFRDDLQPGEFGFPLPPNTRPAGRLSRQSGSRGTRTIGRFTSPLAPRAVGDFYRQQLPGRVEVIARGEGPGLQVTVHQTTRDRLSTVRASPAAGGAGSTLYVVVRDD